MTIFMNRYYGIILLGVWFLLLSGCSTVDRYSYYSPDLSANLVSGPMKPPCGWSNFGGKPDTFEQNVGGEVLSISAYQGTDVYLFGPWFVSVVPVFPISWMINLFVPDDLTISGNKFFSTLAKEDVSITYDSPKGTPIVLHPAEIKRDQWGVDMIFPVKVSQVHSFTLHIKNSISPNEVIEIPFSKTARWTWKQVTVNC